ncbi:MAG: hypothetical protein CMM81_10655 [Rhodospirillales bacterium]|mgnify:FL=1|jgi:3',5'-cyclic AMP phosphodiesterase CpdA|uniref:phosphodiesterase n=1 Tax=Hwanghaeella sp. 1Z406 TaxID=3402811 RepID=UPI000C92FB05|nr:hypothetical protein [Rhodospirillales bacterium]|tara:strand:- start:121 stop:939 length:819 start_codon:yes stop_codon:yes gene_type:complete
MRIAQLTDTHIKAPATLAYGRVDTARYLEAAVAHINSMASDLDAVFITGDLVDGGKAIEYAVLYSILSGLTVPFYLACGNHDDRAGIRQAFPDPRYDDDPKAPLQYVIEWKNLRGIVLDSSVPGESHGQFCESRLAWLADTLKARPDIPAMIFMHHPPFVTGIHHMDVQNLRQPERFFEVLTKAGTVRHIACGHVHRACETVLNGIGVSIAPSPAHAVSLDFDPTGQPGYTLEPPLLRVFNVSDKGQVVSHLSPIGQFDGPHPFFNSDGSFL